MSRPELDARPRWRRTGHHRFPFAALVDGQWWVLRLNSFPDHAHWTLFVDGHSRLDLDDPPPAWERPTASAPALDSGVAEAVVTPVQHLVAYGSEVGRPCDDPFCCG
ncbi:hypothetical protein GA0074692_4361 [Micromonospora pallida]|uniref:Uncharacterized protein n=1 Tax=Micromonospora pallida TaxID=145854 RepID=A0A1C6T3W4_9ACTN|nr:hypothetical protein [Micromonospora pallida]SCL36474.1 hypothetical protein GA0074692_4361 [Micromonospora pallida]